MLWAGVCENDEEIVFGVARLEKPRSKSASAGAKPGGFEAPINYPFILRVLKGGIVFGVARAVRTCSNLPRLEFSCQRVGKWGQLYFWPYHNSI